MRARLLAPMPSICITTKPGAVNGSMRVGLTRPGGLRDGIRVVCEIVF
jgi:hypothetical protein